MNRSDTGGMMRALEESRQRLIEQDQESAGT